jgi:hypothetical protein
VSRLDAVGEMKPGYRHVPKVIHPAPPVAAGGGLLKWYDIAEGDKPIPGLIGALARDDVQRAVGGDVLDGELGFVILHRCGESFYFLLVASWRNDNELWETVWAKPGDDQWTFEPWPLDEGHHPTFCAWELRAVCHEQGAWSRYLRSGRDANAKREYLEDTYTGAA